MNPARSFLRNALLSILIFILTFFISPYVSKSQSIGIDDCDMCDTVSSIKGTVNFTYIDTLEFNLIYLLHKCYSTNPNKFDIEIEAVACFDGFSTGDTSYFPPHMFNYGMQLIIDNILEENSTYFKVGDTIKYHIPICWSTTSDITWVPCNTDCDVNTLILDNVGINNWVFASQDYSAPDTNCSPCSPHIWLDQALLFVPESTIPVNKDCTDDGYWRYAGNNVHPDSSIFLAIETDTLPGSFAQLSFVTNDIERMRIRTDQIIIKNPLNDSIYIPTSPHDDAILIVNGKITATESVVAPYNQWIYQTWPWPDYVFEENYELESLKEVEKYIKMNKHLKDVPSTDDILENGVNVYQLSSILLKKLEELTLHTIDINKKTKQLQDKIIELEIRGSVK